MEKKVRRDFGKRRENPYHEQMDGQWNLLLGNGFSMWYANLYHKAKELLLGEDSIIEVMTKLMEESVTTPLEKFKKKAEEAKDKQCKADYKMIVERLRHLEGMEGEEPLDDEKEKIKERLNKQTNFEDIFGLFAVYKDLSKTLYNEHIKCFQNLSKSIAEHESYVRHMACLAILTTHPKLYHQDQGKGEEIITGTGVVAFFKHMNNIFTTNYDAILYSILTTLGKDNADQHLFADCFGNFIPESSEFLEFKGFSRGFSKAFSSAFYKNSRVFFYYLHGAFHIVREDGRAVKLKNIPSTEDTPENLVRSFIENEFTFSCVIGGDEKQKESIIGRSEYLRACRDNFRSITGNLIVFGHSMTDRDGHIVNWIAHNEKLKNIRIYYHGNDGESEMEKVKEKIEKKRKAYNNGKEDVAPLDIVLRNSKDINSTGWHKELTNLKQLDGKSNDSGEEGKPF